MTEKIRNRILLFVLLIIGWTNVFSQDNSIFDDNRVHYKREIHGGFFLHNYGWGLDFAKYYHQTVDKQRYYELQFSFIHHPKQQKTYSYVVQDPNGYYYGKLNTFFVFRAIYGKKHIIAHKIRSSGVELAIKWGVGPSLGFLKPVYLDIFVAEAGGFFDIQRYDPDRHGVNNIAGRAGGFYGFDEIKFKPGVFLKVGVQIEYSMKNTGVTGIEAGFALDSYLEPIEIMAYIDNYQIFPMLYLNFFFGMKHNKL